MNTQIHPKVAVDGHDNLRGVFGGEPSSVPFGYAQNAMNRFFREDRNTTRPSIVGINLTFETEDDRIWFAGANGQGAFFYQSYPSNLAPKLIASLGGRIYTIEIQGRNGTVRKLWDGNAREFLHAWFAQGFEYLLIQDGINPPVIWDGTNAARRSDLTKNEVPIGSVMEFIHGRFVVASADGKNTIRISEIASAANVTQHADILTFPDALPTYGTATNLGNIQGLYSMPFLDVGTGAFELVAMCQYGFTSFDFSRPEEQLLEPGVQKISLIGTGLVGSHAFAGLNGDVFYRSQSGISSYRNARVEYSQGWRQTPVSREVNYWIQNDRADLLEYIPMVSWQNMVFTGCSPLISPPSNLCLGYHRFCRGMVVFDAQSMSTAGRDGVPVWHGAWTGIRPWAFAHGIIGNQDRCFAFSFDRDGTNRLYEITLTQQDDLFEQQTRKIFSYYLTGDFGAVEGRTSRFDPKKFVGGMLEMNNVLRASTVQVQYRQDGAPCWIDVDRAEPGCDCPDYTETSTEGCFGTSWPVYARKYFPAVLPDKCTPGTNQAASVFRHCQARVLITGNMQIERFQIQMELQPDGKIAQCLGNECRPIQCCPSEFDYSYHIAPLDTNTEIPAITCEPQPITYTSTRYTTQFCPGSTTLFATGFGQATSTISQADADQKAQAAAQANAEAKLNCPNCAPQLLTDAIVESGGAADFSGYFTSGQFQNNIGQPWRLIEVTSETYIVSGVVNASGTLEVVTVFPSYDDTFDTTTFIYSYTGPGSVRVQLQIGCLSGGTIIWPSTGDYGV